MQDSRVLGFAYYYLAEAYFYCNEYNKFMKNLILGLEHQLKQSTANLLAKTYNMLGIHADNQGSTSEAVDYYLTALNYCQDYGLTYEAGIVTANIGNTYATLLDYKKAVYYLEKSLYYLKTVDEKQNNKRALMIIHVTIATCYLKLGDKETASKWFKKIEKRRDELQKNSDYFVGILGFEIQFYHAKAEYYKRDKKIKQMVDLIEKIPSLLQIYDEVFAFCDTLKKVAKYEELGRVLERVELLTVQAGISNIHSKVVRYKIQYYQMTGKSEEYLSACAQYFLLSEQLEIESRLNAKRTIELRMDLETVRKKQNLMLEENKLLLEKSQRDPLTKLPNRDKMNEYTEFAFEKAYKNKVNLAVEILDLDYFKEYNDTFGHQAGDECLKKIAKLLHKLMNKGIFCARYGGDEFIILYEDKTDEEILEIAEKLKQDVIDLKLFIDKKSPHHMVTISQGIRNSVPQKGNKVWDYFYVADAAMYKVKREGKNNIKLIHNSYEQ